MAVIKIHTTKPIGVSKKSVKWYIQFRDHLYIVRRLPAYRNKLLSQQLERRLIEIIEYRRANTPFSSDIVAFLQKLDKKILTRLQKWGIVQTANQYEAKTFNLLAMYIAHLENNGRRKRYIDTVYNRINYFLQHTQIRVIEDITAPVFESFRQKISCSAKTKNHYLSEINTFLSWLVEQDIIIANPLGQIKPLKAVCADYGVLTPLQFQTLTRQTQELTTTPYGLTGRQRSLFYLVAGNTGFRISELLGIRWDFLREGIIYLPPELTKNHKPVHQPVPQAIVEQIRKRGGQHSSLVFDFSTAYKNSAARVLRQDLAACGLPLQDNQGRKIVFHSLRASYISFLANQDIPFKIIQQLARHSTASLTMDVYAKAYDSSLQAAIGKLPR